MSGQVGADIEQLRELGHSLQQRTGDISNIRATVDSAVANTLWTGPARDRFVMDWEGSFTSVLNNLSEAFETAGSDCKRRAETLQQWGG
jgi:hypothetical protein